MHALETLNQLDTDHDNRVAAIPELNAAQSNQLTHTVSSNSTPQRDAALRTSEYSSERCYPTPK
jgi:hypothetical protein